MNTVKTFALAALGALALTAAAGAANAQPYHHGPAYSNVRNLHQDGSYTDRYGNRVYPNPVRPVGIRANNASYTFDVLDRNRDNQVSRREFTRQYGNSRRVGNLFYHLDTNRSGVLGRTEIYNGMGQLPRV